MSDSPRPELDPAVGSAVNDEAAITRHGIDTALSDGTADLATVWTLVDAEQDTHRPVGHMHLRRILLDLPHIGEVHADQILADLELPADRHVAAIGVNQREALELAVAEFA